ncbi:MAG: hypothetical protein ACM3MK_05655 [Chitinophagales bacterium]
MGNRTNLPALLVIFLILTQSQNKSPLVVCSCPHFTDRLISLINHQVIVYTTHSNEFDGILAAVNADYVTLYTSSGVLGSIFIPTGMITAVALFTQDK